jgi:hypothetical protein
MDPNSENPPPSAQIAEVDVDIQTEVSSTLGTERIEIGTHKFRRELYLLRVHLWNRSWRARSFDGRSMTAQELKRRLVLLDWLRSHVSQVPSSDQMTGPS